MAHKEKMASHHGTSEHESAAWGHGQMANMPQDVKMPHYPKAHEMGPGMEDDTISRIDAECARAHMKPHKYMSNQH